MTSAQVPSRIAMSCPFGGFGTENITPIQNLSGADVNFPDGFPAIYGAPVDNNGRFVTRKEMNAIGNLASNDLFYHKCGGLNTFDADFCVNIGGYPKGAVLDYLVGFELKKVVSLTENNKFCFTGEELSEDQISEGLKVGKVDNINWAYLNHPFISGELFSGGFSIRNGFTTIFTFVSPKSGTLNITVENPNITTEKTEITLSSGATHSFITPNKDDSCVIIKDITNSTPADLKYPGWVNSSSSNTYNDYSWKVCYGSCVGYYFSSSGSGIALTRSIDLYDMSIMSGNKYMIAVGAGGITSQVDSTKAVSRIYTFSGTLKVGIT